MITEDFVPYETAKLLVKKNFGYDAEYESYYTLHGEIVYFKDNSNEINIAPHITLQMAMKWLREKHNLFIQITVDFSDGAYPMYDVCVFKLATCTPIIVNGYNRYSYKEACEAAIKFCCENLI